MRCRRHRCRPEPEPFPLPRQHLYLDLVAEEHHDFHHKQHTGSRFFFCSNLGALFNEKELLASSAKRIVSTKVGLISVQLSVTISKQACLAQRLPKRWLTYVHVEYKKESKDNTSTPTSTSISATTKRLLWRDFQRLTTSKQSISIITFEKPCNEANMTPSCSASVSPMKDL